MSDVKQVTVYSAPWCGFCHAAKQYLNSIGVEYVEKDVDADPNMPQSLLKSQAKWVYLS